MADVVLFHHALGLTDGCLALADELRAAGHTVHTPDLYEGRTFTDLDEGVAHAESVGFATVVERGRRAAERLPSAGVVYVGLSLGVLPAESLALTQPGAGGAVLLHAAVLPADLGGAWPGGLRLQLHVMEDDDWGDVEVARQLAATIDTAELFLYPGRAHLFTDRGTAGYDEQASAAVLDRLLAFLAAVG